MSILITGGCGFIGSNFINYIFNKTSEKIINIDALYYCASESNVNSDIRDSPRYKFIKGNITQQDLINFILKEYQIKTIIHFAAQSHVDNSFSVPLQYTHDNIIGTHTLLEASRIYNNLDKFIHVSTDEVYGESLLDDGELSKTEHSVLAPSNPYAATKASAELIAQSYYHSFKLPIIITRGNNVYGPNQYPEKLIPKFINQLKENKQITIQGNGLNKRSFLHVDDVSTAFEIIMNKGVIGQIYNIGSDSDTEYSVVDIGKILINFIKNSTAYDDYISYIEDRPFNDKRYYINNSKLKDLGWVIKVNFIDGLQKLI